jgi:hypothetical protein
MQTKRVFARLYQRQLQLPLSFLHLEVAQRAVSRGGMGTSFDTCLMGSYQWREFSTYRQTSFSLRRHLRLKKLVGELGNPTVRLIRDEGEIESRYSVPLR